MMDYSNKKVLHINLSKNKYDIESYPDLKMFIGGVGLGLKLASIYKSEGPISFCVGPLNGFFPFVSKTAAVFETDDGLEDIYVGGNLSFRIKFAGLDSILLTGKARQPTILNISDEVVTFEHFDSDIGRLGLPGKRSVLSFINEKLMLDEYFGFGGDLLSSELSSKNIVSMVITGTKTYEVPDIQRYSELYKTILKRANELSIISSDKPSCSGCPLGCESSKKGEVGGNVLVHSLVACSHAQAIYSDVGTVFSCLNSLGYDYTHEDIEALPQIIKSVLKKAK